MFLLLVFPIIAWFLWWAILGRKKDRGGVSGVQSYQMAIQEQHVALESLRVQHSERMAQLAADLDAERKAWVAAATEQYERDSRAWITEG